MGTHRGRQQDNTSTRIHGGLGLGLAIVRHLIEQHGGAVRAESPGLGRGATFSVHLPLLSAHEESPAGVPPATSLEQVDSRPGEYVELHGVGVLVIDDDPATREAVAETLRDLGAQVRTADCAAVGMSLLRAFRPSVLVCDIAMPGEDGYALIHDVRALRPDAAGSTPALALTALGTEDDRRRALAAGFQMHLTKPVDIERLSHAVAELAERGTQPSAGAHGEEARAP
jgi:two-component system CheB/CheR fusion protein